MTTLDELLSPVVNEHDRAFLEKEVFWQCRNCGEEFDKPCSSHPKHHPGCTGETCRPECPIECGPVDEMREWPDALETPLAEYRLIVVRATLQEAAKLVCKDCASGEHRFSGPPHFCHLHKGTEHAWDCPAAPIHARLAKEKP